MRDSPEQELELVGERRGPWVSGSAIPAYQPCVETIFTA